MGISDHAHTLAALNPEKKRSQSWLPRRLGGPHCWYGLFGKQKSFTSPGNWKQFLDTQSI